MTFFTYFLITLFSVISLAVGYFTLSKVLTLKRVTLFDVFAMIFGIIGVIAMITVIYSYVLYKKMSSITLYQIKDDKKD